MLNNLKLCLSLQLKLLMSETAGKLQNKKKKNAKNWMFLVVLGSLIYMSLTYTFLMSMQLPSHQKYAIIYVMTMMGVFFSFILCMQISQGHLFAFKDYDFLMSLPISRMTVMLSKLLSFLLMGYAYSALMILPALIVYWYNYGKEILMLVYGLIGFVFVPLVPLTLCAVIAFLIRVLAGNSKYRNLITNLLSIGSVVLILLSTQLFSSSTTSTTELPLAEMVSFMLKYVPFAGYYAKSIVEVDLVSLLIASGLSLVVFGGFVYLFSKTFIKINANSQVGYHVKNYKLTTLVNDSVMITLIKKELRRFFGNFMYVMNMGIGQVMLMIGAVYLMFNKEMIFSVLYELAGIQAVTQTKEMAYVLIIGMLIMLAGMSNTACVSVSLEGKQLWIIKSLPVNAIEVLFSKIAVNFIVIVIPSLISFVLVSFTFEFNALQIILGLFAIILTGLLIGLFGVTLNLFFPRLEFDREILVIKQSASSFIGILGGMLFGIGTLLLMVYLISNIGINFMLVIGGVVIVLAIADLILWQFVKTKGVLLFNQLI